MSTRHGWLAALLAVALAACGGSGSTGLVSPEGALLREVRDDGTCVTSDEMVTYCATGSPDAVSPAGASAFGPTVVVPQPTATPGGTGATPAPAATATIAASATAAPTSAPSARPTPCGTGACPARITLQFLLRGLPDAAVCALAARPAGGDAAWSTGDLVPAGGETRTIDVVIPSTVGPGTVEVALLCFDERPARLPTTLPTLAAASPDVAFVPAGTVVIPPAT